MSAKEQMSKLLDQLMGQNRDGDDESYKKHFTDKTVCRPYLLGICISELFINTRAELAECPKVHSLTMREEYEKASQQRDYHFEEEVLEFLGSFLRDNERKIEGNKKRLELTDETPEMETKAQEIHEFAVQIGEKVAKAEALGAEGKVDESLAVMSEVEEIKAKKKAVEDDYHSIIPRHTVQQQKLRACEVCGAFLSMYDNDRRLADHFGGKLHIGFVTIREKIKQLEEAITAKEERRRQEREQHQKERESHRSRSSERERDRDQDRDRNRERERDRTRDRDRDRDRDRARNYERDRKRDWDRERERRFDRAGDRRERDRDRRRERSRSRERRRSDSR